MIAWLQSLFATVSWQNDNEHSDNILAIVADFESQPELWITSWGKLKPRFNRPHDLETVERKGGIQIAVYKSALHGNPEYPEYKHWYLFVDWPVFEEELSPPDQELLFHKVICPLRELAKQQFALEEQSILEAYNTYQACLTKKNAA